MSDFLRPFRFPRSDGDSLAIEEIAPVPFLIQDDPGSVEAVTFPVKAGNETPKANERTEATPEAPQDSKSETVEAGASMLEGSPPNEGGAPAAVVDPEQDSAAAAAAAELEEAKAAFARAAAELAAARQDLITGVQEDLIDLAVEIGRALVDDELEQNAEVHRTLVQSAFEELGAVTSARLRASASSHEALEAMLDEDGMLSGVVVDLVRDDALEGHGVLVEVEGRVVDGRVATRLESIRRMLRETLIAHRAEEEEQRA